MSLNIFLKYAIGTDAADAAAVEPPATAPRQAACGYSGAPPERDTLSTLPGLPETRGEQQPSPPQPSPPPASSPPHPPAAFPSAIPPSTPTSAHIPHSHTQQTPPNAAGPTPYIYRTGKQHVANAPSPPPPPPATQQTTVDVWPSSAVCESAPELDGGCFVRDRAASGYSGAPPERAPPPTASLNNPPLATSHTKNEAATRELNGGVSHPPSPPTRSPSRSGELGSGRALVGKPKHTSSLGNDVKGELEKLRERGKERDKRLSMLSQQLNPPTNLN